MANEKQPDEKMRRREFVRSGMRTVAALAVGSLAGAAAVRAKADEYVWQIDPDKCTQCGRCATDCVLRPSAVKCFHTHGVCGYCDLCGGFHIPTVTDPDTPAEQQLCPTAALERKWIEGPYFEYSIKEDLCIGCALCVQGCEAFGNGSLYMQVQHELCDNCNECAIAVACPADAFVRIPVKQAYLLRRRLKK